MSKIIYEFQVNNYHVMKVERMPTTPFSKVTINDITYNLVPVYDMPYCIAIEANGKFLGMNVVFE